MFYPRARVVFFSAYMAFATFAFGNALAHKGAVLFGTNGRPGPARRATGVLERTVILLCFGSMFAAGVYFMRKELTSFPIIRVRGKWIRCKVQEGDSVGFAPLPLVSGAAFVVEIRTKPTPPAKRHKKQVVKVDLLDINSGRNLQTANLRQGDTRPEKEAILPLPGEAGRNLALRLYTEPPKPAEFAVRLKIAVRLKDWRRDIEASFPEEAHIIKGGEG